MKNDPTDIAADRYEIGVVPNEHGGYYARIPDFPTIFTGGRTPDEAMKNAQKAIALMIEECRERERGHAEVAQGDKPKRSRRRAKSAAPTDASL